MKVRELLSDKSKWTTGKLARDKNGNNILTQHPDATCWCVLGACMKCGVQTADYNRFVNLCVDKYGESIVYVNDFLGYEAVLALVNEADI